MFETARSEFGGFDILCPGAGVYEPHWSNFWVPPGAAASRDAVDAGRYALLDINLTHPIRATQIAISNWLYPQDSPTTNFPTPDKASPANQKRIIHIASVASQIPVFRAPMYGASKFAISGFVRSIGPLESCGIKINAVAPGIVKTPLWSDHPEKLQNIDPTKDAWVTPDEVADVMLECIESPARGGGVVIEVGAGSTREVKTFNDPGPNMDPAGGIVGSNGDKGDEEVHGFLRDVAVWARERS